MTSPLPRPEPTEYAEYYGRYIGLVPDDDIVETLATQFGETLALLQAVPPERETFRYAEGKWSIREVVGHLLDVERVMAYRALHMARTDDADIPGMDQDVWAAHSNAGGRPLDDLAAEWGMMRRANVHFFAGLGADAGERTGVASGFRFSVRSFPWIIAGHELWHRQRLGSDYGVATRV
jgi:hypothetical protein